MALKGSEEDERYFAQETVEDRFLALLREDGRLTESQQQMMLGIYAELTRDRRA